MDANQDIRRANLALLLDEVARGLGTTRGAAAELSRRTGVPASTISQVLNRRLHQGGDERQLGDKQARKLERGMSKDKGWMDVAHNSEVTERDAETLASMQALTPDQRSLIEAQISEFARLNRPPSDPAGSLLHTTKPH